MGNAGTGKSKLVEKVTGKRGLSSSASASSKYSLGHYDSVDDSLIISDTPGINSLSDQSQFNIRIADVLSSRPVNLVLITVKACTRMESVLKCITEYMQCFDAESFPMELIRFCITHMDTVTWVADELEQHLKSNLDIGNAIFSCPRKKSQELIQEIKYECSKNEAVTMEINSDMFSNLLKINDHDVKISRETRKEVARFEKIKHDFYIEQNQYSEAEQIDRIFEFGAWIDDEIVETKNRFLCKFDFRSSGEQGKASEESHMANLTIKLGLVLQDVTRRMKKYNKDIKTDFRKCPHCGKIWKSKKGCEWNNKCGQEQPELFKHKKVHDGKMATFTFLWDQSVQKLFTFKITQGEDFCKKNDSFGNGATVEQNGCGRKIIWSKMAPVKFEADLKAGKFLCTKHIHALLKHLIDKLRYACVLYKLESFRFMPSTRINLNPKDNRHCLILALVFRGLMKIRYQKLSFIMTFFFF